MRRLSWLGMFFVFACCAAGTGQALAASGFTALEGMQIHACRATSSLLLYRGEGFQKAHLARMEADLSALDGALLKTANATAELITTQRALVATLRQGASFGRNEEDVPWTWSTDLAKSLRDFLTEVRAQQGANAKAELPAKVEYLAVQYLSRAYIGSFETAREQPDTYLGQDERQLVPSIDTQLADLAGQGDPAIAKLRTRWEFLKVALVDMNSGNNSFNSASGRPYAPITVDRHTRSLSDQWMALAP